MRNTAPNPTRRRRRRAAKVVTVTPPDIRPPVWERKKSRQCKNCGEEFPARGFAKTCKPECSRELSLVQRRKHYAANSAKILAQQRQRRRPIIHVKSAEKSLITGRAPRPAASRNVSKNIGGCMHINTIWQPEKNSSRAIAKGARSGPPNPGNASVAGKILWSQIAKMAEPTPARSADTPGNFRWSGRDTTRGAANDQAKTGAFHHE